jgi:uncharacterized damage-inducible protein DinB
MSFKQAFIAELKFESDKTRKVLERIPMDKADWKPHAKSMSIGRLSTHTAELFDFITTILTTDELNFATRDYKPHTAANSEELLSIADTKLREALKALEAADDAEFDKMWTMRNGDHIIFTMPIFTMPKKVAIRNLAFNHQYHHRGQLTVYLRLLDVPVPGVYGPSADETFAPAAASLK